MNFNILTNPISVIEAETILQKPYIYNQKDYNFKDYFFKLPQTGLFSLQNVIVSDNILFDQNKNFLIQFTWFEKDIERYKGFIQQYINHYFSIEKKINTIPLIGNSIYLGAFWGSCNIGHAILDGFSKLYMYQQYFNNDLSNIDHILINKPSGNEIDFLINSAGLDRNKIKIINDRQRYFCENIFISEMIGRKRQYKKVLKNFYTKLYPRKKNDGSRLFVIRKNFRYAINQLEVIALLEKYNFKICYNFPTMDDFAKADIIVSPHSCTLTKLMFCNPDTKVVELISDSHQYSYYYELCRIFNLKYTGLLCISEDKNPHKTKNNFTVDLKLLEEIIRQNI